MGRSCSLYLEFDSTEPYGDNALLMLNNGWTPCFQGSMVYAPPEHISQQDAEEPCDPQKLVRVIREKERLGETITFLATHPGLQYCCDFNFSADGWVLVNLSNEGEAVDLMSAMPNFDFYVASILKVFAVAGRRIHEFSFKYG